MRLDQNSSVDSEQTCSPESPSEVQVKLHKRPAPLPLPALARFLKQHSSRSKKAKSQSDSAESSAAETNTRASGSASADQVLSALPGEAFLDSCPDASRASADGSDQPPQRATSPPDTVLPSLKAAELPDPECSSLGFEPLSPASSPEPLPGLPASLELELDSAASGPPLEAPEDSDSSRFSSLSVFKWHTVLPPPGPYIAAPFGTFQPQHSDPLHTSTPPSTDLSPSFQDNDQSLPFPAELSPLALQLPLSPTFSSLDGGGLSPTPSLADLVHFFSTDDDLGMGVEFSNAEATAVSCSPLRVEVDASEPQQVQPAAANRPSNRKKTRRRRLSRTDVNQKVGDSTYAKMQPNLEEVEEQLFISFTSKVKQKDLLYDVESKPGFHRKV